MVTSDDVSKVVAGNYTEIGLFWTLETWNHNNFDICPVNMNTTLKSQTVKRTMPAVNDRWPAVILSADFDGTSYYISLNEFDGVKVILLWNSI